MRTLLAALVAFFAVCAQAIAASVVLSAPVNITTDTRPGGIVVGDFNNDARPDLLVLNFTTVTMLLSKGDGTFQTGVTYPISVNASLGAVSDLDGDGNLDVVLSNFAGNNVIVLLGRGDGTFAAPASVTVGSRPAGIELVMLNPTAGAEALVVVNNGSNNITVHPGDGEGGFGAATAYPVGRDPRVLAVGDFNTDGRQDIVVTNFGDNNVAVLVNNGDGTLKAPVNYAVGVGPQAVAVGDVNGDGKLDLVVVNNTAATVSVLFGNGDGTFKAATTFAAGGNLPRYVAIADIDGDGQLDLTVSSNAANSVAVLKGRGDGTFGAPVVFATGLTPNDVRAVDLNGDNKPDIVAANFGANTISVLFNRSVLPVATVVEFYNTILDQYFMTANPDEQQAVSSGAAGPGWSATGNTFNAGGPLQVCRFYGSQSPGPNSHFYTIDPNECQALKNLQATTPATQKRWNFESNDFSSSQSANQQCAGDLVPVYRAYNNGAARGVDSNHRITSSRASYDAQIAKGWIAEGVVMCAPESNPSL